MNVENDGRVSSNTIVEVGENFTRVARRGHLFPVGLVVTLLMLDGRIVVAAAQR
jgi:hypothetical protein